MWNVYQTAAYTSNREKSPCYQFISRMKSVNHNTSHPTKSRRLSVQQRANDCHGLRPRYLSVAVNLCCKGCGGERTSPSRCNDRLFQREFDEFDARCPDVSDATRDARILPVEVA